MFKEIKLNFSGSDQEEFIPIFNLGDEDKSKNSEIPSSLPIIALKNTVLFPGNILPITIGRSKSIKAVKQAFKNDKYLAVFTQKEVDNEDPSAEDLYQIGTVATVVKLIKMPDGNTTAILQGRTKCQLEGLESEDPYLIGQISLIEEKGPTDKKEFNATISSIKDLSKRIIKMSPHIPEEAKMMLDNLKTPNFLLNFIASNLDGDVAMKQSIMEINSQAKKAKKILNLIDKQLQLVELKNKIESKVRGDIEKQQRDYFLNQQLKTIQEELGQNPNREELLALEAKAKDIDWPEAVAKQFNKELTKAKRINPQIAEYSVTLSYLETLVDLPWGKYTDDNFDLKNVKAILDKDHYGLKDVKERILEHLAVLKLKGDMKAPIICLVGPPGVGKTSLGKSIAKALNREFIRMSLGGLHDESEVRGHRKTYIGAMPGRIIKSIRKAGSSNPVFILDEIDKIGKDFRGDPSSALLEVLDPEQNTAFQDNYIDVDYDLSKVLFIATANSLSTIQPALRDRMEIIQLSGYSVEEKIEIAKKHLVPKQRLEHGLKANQIKLNKTILEMLVQGYTKESGVRSLERKIAGVMRSVAKRVAMEETYNITVTEEDVITYLSHPIFDNDKYAQTDTPGVAVGLAWTRVGGDILFIETSLSKGKGKLILTGNLGDVMKESATTALSYIKSNHETLNIDTTEFDEKDVHIHNPEGAIPKDGPSAGITMFSAIVSAFKQEVVQPYLAMSGEITLRGKVLPVGGIKEKVLAAKRSGMKKVMLCEKNRKDIEKIDPDFIKGLEVIYVNTMDDVFREAIS